MAKTDIEKKGPQEVTRPEDTRGGRYFVPRVDICEKEGELTVLADMPGVRAEDVDVRFERGELAIHGRVQPRQTEGRRVLLREYEVGDYYRSFRVGEQIDASNISAEMKFGVLTLHLPKKEEAKPKQISVQAK